MPLDGWQKQYPSSLHQVLIFTHKTDSPGMGLIQPNKHTIDPDKDVSRKIIIPINLNMCFGCSKEQSH